MSVNYRCTTPRDYKKKKKKKKKKRLPELGSSKELTTVGQELVMAIIVYPKTIQQDKTSNNAVNLSVVVEPITGVISFEFI